MKQNAGKRSDRGPALSRQGSDPHYGEGGEKKPDAGADEAREATERAKEQAQEAGEEADGKKGGESGGMASAY